MKIKSIELKNFKFHHHLKFDIKKQNCLIYGENGTGKSSIYQALYSNFYFYKNRDIANKRLNIRDKFRHRNFLDEELEVNIDFNEFKLNRKDDELDNREKLLGESIFFTNEKVLSSITEGNFLEIITYILFEHFPQLRDVTLTVYTDIKNDLKSLEEKLKKSQIKKNKKEEFNFEEKLKELNIRRREIDKKLKASLEELIPLEDINAILKNDLRNEELEIEFNFISSSSIKDTGVNHKFNNPYISIKVKGVEDKNDLLNHFNEAKLKLIGIAIYFSLVKKYGDESKDIKLLVLDDFLTSLDIANRTYIIQYILKEFKNYQKILLTHNIQFYNLIIKLLDATRDESMSKESKKWDIKTIFFRKINNNYETLIYDSDSSYLEEAENYLKENKLNESGVFLRKEFERILEELRKKIEVGAKEKLSNIITTIIDIKDTSDINIKKIQTLLLETKFYQDTILHPTAHDDRDRDITSKELQGAVVILKQLDKQLNKLRA